MVGVDEDWVDAGTRNYVSYPNLSPGEYVFEVKAANNDGVWNETPRRITILISPPFWKTPWFIVLSGLILIVGFTWLIRDISTRRLRAEMKLQNERERISRDLHDHVGAQLVTILSGLDLAGKDRSRSDDILASVREEAQTTIRQLRDTIWTLKSAAITPDAFLSHIERYVRQLEQLSALPVTLRSDITASPTLSPAVALNAFRIVQEALQNILKHSGASAAEVDIRVDAGGLTITVSDNGRFREPDPDAFTGSGLGNMRKRAEDVGGKVSIDGTSTGTTVELHVAIA
jgi:signal transduction histidine kinase